MTVLPWADFIRLDSRVPLFGPLGLMTDARLTDEAAAEFVQRMIAEVHVGPSVPNQVRDYFEYSRKTFIRGFFSYELFTVAWFVATLAEEFALGERFMARVGGQVTFQHRSDSRSEVRQFATFRDLVQSYKRGRAYSPSEWQLVEAKDFAGSFGWLMKWAHREAVLKPWLDTRWLRVRRGVHSHAMTGGTGAGYPPEWGEWTHEARGAWFSEHGREVWELGQVDATVELRNLIAHPAADILITPMEASRQIASAGEFITEIWSQEDAP